MVRWPLFNSKAQEPVIKHPSQTFRLASNPRFLLAAMLLQIVVTPLTQNMDFPFGRLVRTLTVLAAIDMTTETRRDLLVGLTLGIPTIFLAWLSPWWHSPALT